ncbi:Nmad2 family putative nucleotide modification protein [Halorussus amylolyticus]|uniref:Nmad2 family putative nucleotide modification protein n=1 Tax=Halorussus amylolyticus TaxID=1126242 RepID=UPI00105144B1|nr:hypothetical protein [Halorussus amylolyticus]
MSTISTEGELHSYVIEADTGFAPNVTDSVCTLATCKQVIRDEAKEGDWVLGTYPRDSGEERMTYLMRVSECLTYDEYYTSGRFDFKKPENDPRGDNIYHRNESGILVQVENPPEHDDPESRKRDLKSNKVLIADKFWYFGDRGPELPPRLYEVIKGYKSDSRSGRKKPTEYLDELVDWLSERYELGVHGEPRDDSSTSCGCGSPNDTGSQKSC